MEALDADTRFETGKVNPARRLELAQRRRHISDELAGSAPDDDVDKADEALLDTDEVVT